MSIYHNTNLTQYSQKLRREMTKEEKALWYKFLKNLPYNIYRQKVFGDYIADFYCPKYKTVIELDGSQHYEDEGLEKDRERDLFFNSIGIRVLRYSNLDINRRFKDICADILKNFGEI